MISLNPQKVTEHKDKKKYRISPRLKKLMGKVTIDPKEF